MIKMCGLDILEEQDLAAEEVGMGRMSVGVDREPRGGYSISNTSGSRPESASRDFCRRHQLWLCAWRFLAFLGIFIPALCDSSQYWLVYEVVVQVIYDNTIETMLCYCRNLAD